MVARTVKVLVVVLVTEVAMPSIVPLLFNVRPVGRLPDTMLWLGNPACEVAMGLVTMLLAVFLLLSLIVPRDPAATVKNGFGFLINMDFAKATGMLFYHF
jgi:hypothetical protein